MVAGAQAPVLGQVPKGVAGKCTEAERIVAQDPERALALAQLAKEQAQEANLPDSLGLAYLTLARIYYETSQYRLALVQYDRAITLFQKSGNKQLLAQSLTGYGASQYPLGYYNISEKYYLRALPLFQELNDSKGIARVINNIGGVYDAQNNLPMAMRYYQEALAIRREINDSLDIAQSLHNVGIIYWKLYELTPAIDHFRQAFQIYKALENLAGQARCLQRIGLAYERMGDVRAAIRYQEEAIEVMQQLPSSYELARAYLYKYETLRRNQRFAEALPVLKWVEQYADSTENIILRSEVALGLGLVLQATGQYEQAARYMTLRDSLRALQEQLHYDSQLAELQQQFEAQRREQQIQDLQAQRDRQLTWAWVLVGGLMLVTLLAGLALNAYRLQRKFRLRERELLQQQNALAEAQFHQAQAEGERQEALRKQAETESRLHHTELLNLQSLYEAKQRELTNVAFQMVQKNETILNLRNAIEQMQTTASPKARQGFQQLLHEMDSSLQADQDWDVLKQYFDQVHEGFMDRLLQKHPGLTPNELKLSVYLRMNLSIKEVASLLYVTPKAIEMARYRLRQKMNLNKNDNLIEFIHSI
jgi:tetratricopeptide (TPR) repeat protein